ncbi:hypothetical protein [Lentzea sp. NPDC055074]
MAESAPDWIVETGSAVRRASSDAHAQAELQAVASAARELDQVRTELERLAEAAFLGRDFWWHGVATSPSLRLIVDSLDGALEPRVLAQAQRELKQFVTRLSKALREAWANHIDSQTRDTAEVAELVAFLASSGGHTVAEDLKRGLAELARLKSELPHPAAEKQLAETVQLAEAFKAALPTAVKVFISATAHGGASIEVLDADVLTWLHENGAIKNFKIVAGTPVEVPLG